MVRDGKKKGGGGGRIQIITSMGMGRAKEDNSSYLTEVSVTSQEGILIKCVAASLNINFRFYVK